MLNLCHVYIDICMNEKPIEKHPFFLFHSLVLQQWFASKLNVELLRYFLAEKEIVIERRNLFI